MRAVAKWSLLQQTTSGCGSSRCSTSILPPASSPEIGVHQTIWRNLDKSSGHLRVQLRFYMLKPQERKQIASGKRRNSLLLKMAIETVYLPIKNGDFPFSIVMLLVYQRVESSKEKKGDLQHPWAAHMASRVTQNTGGQSCSNCRGVGKAVKRPKSSASSEPMEELSEVTEKWKHSVPFGHQTWLARKSPY